MTDYLGLKCEIMYMFGHGYTEDVEGNWLLQEAAKVFETLDCSDRMVSLGCTSTQARALLYERLASAAKTDEQLFKDLMKLLEVYLDGTVDFVIDSKEKWGIAWTLAADAIDKELPYLCGEGGCCESVYVTFVCQDDPVIKDLAPKITEWDRLLRERQEKRQSTERYKSYNPLKQLPEGEDFCGKTFRWSCDGRYWELWTWNHRH